MAAKRLFRGRAVPYSLEDGAVRLQFRGRPEAYCLEDGALHLQFRGRAVGATETRKLIIIK